MLPFLQSLATLLENAPTARPAMPPCPVVSIIDALHHAADRQVTDSPHHTHDINADSTVYRQDHQ